jgi:hypothetical protein
MMMKLIIDVDGLPGAAKIALELLSKKQEF